MKEYEITYNGKIKGKVNLFRNNLNKDIVNSLIISDNNVKYSIISNDNKMQQYELEFIINDIDDLYDIVSKYKHNEKDIFEEIEKIKKYNNIKKIHNSDKIKILISEVYLSDFLVKKEDIDQESLFKSKIYFVKKVLELKELSLFNDLKIIVNNYYDLKNNSVYEFLTDDEKEHEIIKFIKEINKLVETIENKVEYKYGRDFIVPIKIKK